IPAYISGGERYRDITFRLKVAGVPEDQLTIIPDLTNMTTAIQKLPTKQVYVVATYTAMLQLRKQLASQGIIDGGMA
ncbi:MurT ligase domain-containing protein, partial [Lactiplantibacillus plantarum]